MIHFKKLLSPHDRLISLNFLIFFSVFKTSKLFFFYVAIILSINLFGDSDNRNLYAAMTNATTKLRFCATPKSDILCNTDVQHGSPPFLQSEILTFFATKLFCCKKC